MRQRKKITKVLGRVHVVAIKCCPLPQAQVGRGKCDVERLRQPSADRRRHERCSITLAHCVLALQLAGLRLRRSKPHCGARSKDCWLSQPKSHSDLRLESERLGGASDERRGEEAR
eukprot:2060937-Rhodomonas_salina.3